MDDGLYPEIEPYQQAKLEREGHSLYYELSGNLDGPTALYVHGGPGAGPHRGCVAFSDPQHYRIVLLDQRGAGQSIPNVSDDYDAALRDNTTAHLVADIEALREALEIDTWELLLGGSWGSTLTLAYAEAHPTRVKSYCFVVSSRFYQMRWTHCFKTDGWPTIIQTSGRRMWGIFKRPARIGRASHRISSRRIAIGSSTQSVGWPLLRLLSRMNSRFLISIRTTSA